MPIWGQIAAGIWKSLQVEVTLRCLHTLLCVKRGIRRVPFAFVGKITGDGKVIVKDTQQGHGQSESFGVSARLLSESPAKVSFACC